MGYWNDMLDKIQQVDAMGFNPYTDTYGNAIGRLDAQKSTEPPNGYSTPEATISASDGSKMLLDGTVEPNLSDIYIKAGYNDPFSEIIDAEGNVNLPALSTGYNIALRDKDLGVNPQGYVDYSNKLFAEQMDKEYGKGKRIVVNPDNSLGISKLPSQEKNINYVFSQGKRQGNDPEGKFKRGDPIYYRWENEVGSDKYITYNSKDEYMSALREKYEKDRGEPFGSTDEFMKEYNKRNKK